MKLVRGFAKNSTITFDHFNCSLSSCCTFDAVKSYSIVYTKNLRFKPIKCCKPVMDMYGVEQAVLYEVKVDRVGITSFHIQGISEEGDELLSPEI